MAARSSRAAAPAARRPARAHRIADHDGRAARSRAAETIADLAREVLGRWALRSSTSTSAAASASRTSPVSRAHARRLCRGRPAGRAVDRARRSCSSRADGSSGPAGVLLTASSTSRRGPTAAWFVIVDAGMTDLLRPALYGAWHTIEAVTPRAGATDCGRHRRVRCARRPTRSARIGRCRRSRSAICSRSATPARTGRSWRRTTIGGRWPPKCWSNDGGWRLVRRRQTIDDMLQWDDVMLIAFEGLDQSGKETQARHLRARLEQDGHRVRAAVVSRLRDARSARRSDGARRRTRFRARGDAAALRREPVRVQAAHSISGSRPATSWSATGTARRASRTARRRGSMRRGSTRSSAICPLPTSRSCSTSRPKRPWQAQGVGPRPVRARPRRCSRACAKAIAARRPPMTGSSSMPSSRRMWSAEAVAAAVAATARATVSARTFLTPASISTLAHASSRRARRHHVVHSTTVPLAQSRRRRRVMPHRTRRRERAATLPCRSAAGRLACGWDRDAAAAKHRQTGRPRRRPGRPPG